MPSPGPCPKRSPPGRTWVTGRPLLGGQGQQVYRGLLGGRAVHGAGGGPAVVAVPEGAGEGRVGRHGQVGAHGRARTPSPGRLPHADTPLGGAWGCFMSSPGRPRLEGTVTAIVMLKAG